MTDKTPIVAIDGPSGVGKGTICRLLVDRFQWNLLDSGAIYRVLALAALHHNVSLTDEQALTALAVHLDVMFTADPSFPEVRVILEGENVSDEIRLESCSQAASKIATFPTVREALLRRQRSFNRHPGLIADGRDMGTIVFPDAEVKVFLTASAEERAKRRFNQLIERGVDVKMGDVLEDVKQRDARDTSRAVAPLVPAKDALVIDTTEMSIEEVFNTIVERIIKISY